MSYHITYEFDINPEDSYSIIRNCPICGGKSIFVNTNNFRVNANGNRLDVWLIYQCSKCKHTYNLTIYERIKADQLSSDLLSNLMNNEKELATKFGTNKSFFIKNKAEIDWSSVKYQIVNKKNKPTPVDDPILFHSGDLIQLNNPCGLKIRNDKIISELLQITRNTAKKLEESGSIKTIKNNLGLSIHLLNLDGA